MYDTNSLLKATATETASANGAGVDLKSGTPRRSLKARALVTASGGTTPTLNLKIQHSTDNATWSDLANFDQITATGEYFVSFETSKRYVRVVSTIAGTTPTFTYIVEATLSRP